MKSSGHRVTGRLARGLSASIEIDLIGGTKMMGRNPVTGESAVRTAVAYLLLLCGIPSLMLAEDIGWPREMTQSGAQIVYYQPQIDSWRDYRILDARMAISVTPAGGKATPGVVSIQARTDADKENRTVVILSLIHI